MAHDQVPAVQPADPICSEKCAASGRWQRLGEYAAVVGDRRAHAGMAQRTPERHLLVARPNIEKFALTTGFFSSLLEKQITQTLEKLGIKPQQQTATATETPVPLAVQERVIALQGSVSHLLQPAKLP
jgi:hypothetical protein